MSSKLKGKSKVVPTGLDEIAGEDNAEVAVDISTIESKNGDKYSPEEPVHTTGTEQALFKHFEHLLQSQFVLVV